MHITDLTAAQEHAISHIEGFERATVTYPMVIDYTKGQHEDDVMAVFKTFQGQEVKVTISKNGVINHVEFTP
jgi:hypothetical protein